MCSRSVDNPLICYYLIQMFFSFRNEKSAKLLKTVLVQEKLNHYGCMAQRGLSSSFSRTFVNYNNITGQVKSSQHIYSGVTKRGSVDIVLEHDNVQYDLCSVSRFHANNSLCSIFPDVFVIYYYSALSVSIDR